MVLNMLNLYSLIFALFNKIEGMSKELDSLQPTLNMNATAISENTLDLSESFLNTVPTSCYEIAIPCLPCHLLVSSYQFSKHHLEDCTTVEISSTSIIPKNIETQNYLHVTQSNESIKPENLKKRDKSETNNLDKVTTASSILIAMKELDRLRNISYLPDDSGEFNETTSENDDYDNNIEYYETVSDIVTTLTNPYSTTYAINRDIEDKTSTETFINNSTWSITSYGTESTSSYHKSTTIKEIEDTPITSEVTMNENNMNLSKEGELTTEKYSGIKYESTSEMPLDTTGNTRFDKTIETTLNDIFSEITTYPTDSESTRYMNKNTVTFRSSTNNIYSINSIDIPPRTNFICKATCPNITFNCSINCGERNITKVFFIFNCTIFNIKCYVNNCDLEMLQKIKQSNGTAIDSVYYDNNRKMYNLTKATQKKLLKLCWETMFGQELVKLTMMDLVMSFKILSRSIN